MLIADKACPQFGCLIACVLLTNESSCRESEKSSSNDRVNTVVHQVFDSLSTQLARAFSAAINQGSTATNATPADLAQFALTVGLGLQAQARRGLSPQQRQAVVRISLAAITAQLAAADREVTR